jgi:hypothetical protein
MDAMNNLYTLDEEVAVKVLGWEKTQEFYWKNPHEFTISIPMFSSFLSEAAIVINFLMLAGYRLLVSANEKSATVTLYGKDSAGSATCPTIAEAVCRAAISLTENARMTYR